MKRTVLAILAALSLAATSLTPILAEETTVYTFSEEDVTVDSEWFLFAEEYQIYLPAEWLIVELTEDEEESGLLLRVADETGTAVVVIGYYTPEETDGMLLDDFVEAYTTSDYYDEVQTFILNGLDAMAFDTATDEDEDMISGIIWVDDDGYAFEVAGTPTNSEEFGEIISNILLSVGPAVDEAELETE